MSSHSRAGPIQLAELALVEDSLAGSLGPTSVLEVDLGGMSFMPNVRVQVSSDWSWRPLNDINQGHFELRNNAGSTTRPYEIDWSRVA